METARVVVLIGGILILIGLFLGFLIVYSTSVAGLAIGPLIPLGFLIGFVCMLVLVFSEDALFLMIAGIFGTISSFLLVGGVVGGIGGILGIVGSALMSGKDSKNRAREEFLAARGEASLSSPSLEQHSIRCPTCGYLNKADSVYCGKCKSPLHSEEGES